MHGYKSSVDAGAEPVTVLVAKDQLPKGSSGDAIARKGLFQATGFKRDQVKEGAITDPASLRGQVAAQNIVPGQQLTIADFVKPNDPVLSRLGEDQRAITRTARRRARHDRPGRMRATTSTCSPDSRYSPMERPGRGRSCGCSSRTSRCSPLRRPARSPRDSPRQSQSQNVVLQVSDKQAVELAFASDNGKLWIALRPPGRRHPEQAVADEPRPAAARHRSHRIGSGRPGQPGARGRRAMMR